MALATIEMRPKKGPQLSGPFPSKNQANFLASLRLISKTKKVMIMTKKDFNKNGYPFSTPEASQVAFLMATVEDTNLKIYNLINMLEVETQIEVINDLITAVSSVDVARGLSYGKNIKQWAERKNIVIKCPEGKIFGWKKGVAVLKDTDDRSKSSAANGAKNTPVNHTTDTPADTAPDTPADTAPDTVVDLNSTTPAPTKLDMVYMAYLALNDDDKLELSNMIFDYEKGVKLNKQRNA